MAKFVLTAQLRLRAPDNLRQVANEIKKDLSFSKKDLGINVKVNGADKAKKSIEGVSNATKQVTTDVAAMGRAFGISLRRFTVFSLASRAIGLFSSKISNAVDEAINFQQEMVRLSQVTDESLKSLKRVSDQISDLSTSFGVSSRELQGVTTVLAQAGLKSKDLRIALDALAKTALAPTFGDIKDTAEGAIAILAQFGEGTAALERQLGAINEVSAKFAVESEDLISVIRRTGGVFKASGGSLEQLLALFTSVRATTRESAESIATGLRTILTRIQRPKTIEYLKQYGIELTDLEGKFIGPYKAIEQLSRALSGLEEGDITFIKIAEELGGFRQIGKVIPLLQQFKISEEALQAALEGGSSLREDVIDSQQAFAIQIAKVREEFLALVRSISETSTFKVLLTSTLNITSAVIKLADSLKSIIPLLGAVAAFRFAKGIGQFFRGVGGGLRNLKDLKKAGDAEAIGFNSGGFVSGVGNRDTIPAMLTPGEFVIKKKSAQSIGYSNLDRMNEQGTVKFAKGGAVRIQKFADGGKPKKLSAESFIGFGVLTTGITYVTESLSDLSKSADDSETSLSRFVDNLGSIATTIATTALLFKSMNVNLKTFGRGEGSLGDIIGGFRGGKQGKGQSFSEGFQSISLRAERLRSIKEERKRITDLSKMDFAESKNQMETFRKNISQSRTPKATSLVGRLGTSLGKTASRGGITGRIAGVAGRGLISAGGGALGGTAGALASIAGPAAAVVGGLSAISSVAATLIDAENKKIQAIENGNTKEAERYAIMSEMDGMFGGLSQTASLVSYKLADFGFITEDTADNFSDFLGGDLLGTTRALAKAQAQATQANKNYAETLKKLEKQREEIASGGKTAREIFTDNPTRVDTLVGSLINLYEPLETASQEYTKIFNDAAKFNNKAIELLKQAKVQDRIVKNLEKRLSDPKTTTQEAIQLQSMRNTMERRSRFSMEGARGNAAYFQEALNTENAKKALEQRDISRGDLDKALSDFAPEFKKLAEELTIQSSVDPTKNATDEFNKILKPLFDRLGSTESGREIQKEIETNFQNQNKAILENIQYWKSLNTGLRETIGRLDAVTTGLSTLKNSIEVGGSDIAAAQKVISASMSSAATYLDPADVENAQNTFRESLKTFGGAAPSYDSIDLAKAMYEAQKAIPRLIENMQKGFGGTAPTEIKQTFEDGLINALGANTQDEIKKAIRNSLSKVDLVDPDVVQKILSGNIEEFTNSALGPLKEVIEKDLANVAESLVNINSELVDLTKQRIELEKSVIDQRRKSLDLELEARQTIEEFGGSLLSSNDKLKIFQKQVDLDLGFAGAGSIGSGGANEIRAAQTRLEAQFRTIQAAISSAAVTGQNPLAGVSGVEKDTRDRIEQAQESIIEYTKRRIDLIKEEISIAERKNKLERDAIDKLLGGDIAGFIQGQSSAAAASALRSGDTQIARLFGPSALGEAVRDLQEQTGGGRELETATRTALESLGIRDQRMSQVYSNTTPEIEALKRSGRDIASTLISSGESLVNTQQMRVTTQTVIINTANAKVRDSINSSFAPGAVGGIVQNQQPSITADIANKLTSGFDSFSNAVQQLVNTEFSVKLDTTNVNVNFNGAGILDKLTTEVKNSVLVAVKNEITNKLEIGNDGKPRFREGIVS